MTENSNIVDHPHRHTSLRRVQVARLKEAFLARGKTQPGILARLSCTVEKLCLEAKEDLGERSGAMKLAFGEELVRMKGRFTARNGVPPAQIYQTPDAWLRVLDGLASVLGKDPESVAVAALEDALSHGRPKSDDSRAHWLDELQALSGHMVERLRDEADLVEVADYVARSGLLLRNEELCVSEWPFDHVGYSDSELYVRDFIGLVPHVFGINYVPVTSEGYAIVDLRDELINDVPELGQLDPATIAAATGFTFNEGIRTGVAAVIHAHSRQMELAMIEWHHADVTLTDSSGREIAKVGTATDLHALVGGDVSDEERAGFIGTPESFAVFRKPDGWVANSIRFHFPGSPGFERVASASIVRPWIWEDPADYDFWSPDPQEAEDCPVVSPRHSVAAAIEGNLLYADAEGQSEHRLDRLLLAEIRRVSTVVNRFRDEHETRRRANREVLLAHWKSKREN